MDLNLALPVGQRVEMVRENVVHGKEPHEADEDAHHGAHNHLLVRVILQIDSNL
jgi:hypothetical protein